MTWWRVDSESCWVNMATISDKRGLPGRLCWGWLAGLAGRKRRRWAADKSFSGNFTHALIYYKWFYELFKWEFKRINRIVLREIFCWEKQPRALQPVFSVSKVTQPPASLSLNWKIFFTSPAVFVVLVAHGTFEDCQQQNIDMTQFCCIVSRCGKQ